MKTFAVYVTAEDNYHAVDVTGYRSAAQIETKLPLHVNWFGARANSAEEAIAIAKANKLKYVEPEKMKDLLEMAKALSNAVNMML